MLLASCKSSCQWHQWHCQGCRQAGSQKCGWQGRPEGTARTEKATNQGYGAESCEGEVCPSDRDQGQTEPRDCQPVHGDEVNPGQAELSLQFRVWISEGHGSAQLGSHLGPCPELRWGQGQVGEGFS